jgi:hypothetical protein
MHDKLAFISMLYSAMLEIKLSLFSNISGEIANPIKQKNVLDKVANPIQKTKRD